MTSLSVLASKGKITDRFSDFSLEMSVVVFSILVLSLIFIVYLEIRKYFINQQLKNIARIKDAPVIGVIGRMLWANNFDVINLIFKAFDEAISSTIRFWAGPILVLGTYDPTSVGIILTHKNALNKPFVYDYFHFTTSLIVADKDIWKPHRRELNSVFSVTTLRAYLPHFNEKSRLLINRMQPFLYETADLYRYISICLMDIAVRTLFGVNMNLQDSEWGERLFETEKNITDGIQYRLFRIWFRYDCIYHNLSRVGRAEQNYVKDLCDIIQQIYDQKVKEQMLPTNTEHGVNNLLEKCLELERQGIYSRKNVMDEMRLAFIAGMDTPSIAIFSTLLMLAINQRHQELVIDEMRSIFESADCDVTQTHLAAMNYTERVIMESMRLLPPVLFEGRRTIADVKLPNGTVPKNTNICISIMHMHRNPQVWGENVLDFDPDRFLPENIEKRPPFSYIPFSAGPRNCIGMKYSMMVVKTTLAHLLQQYKFTTDLKFNEIQFSMALLLRIQNDKPLRIEKRNCLSKTNVE